MKYILLESYKDKISNKLHFARIILDSLKVISEKPQVNQVVPYNGPVQPQNSFQQPQTQSDFCGPACQPQASCNSASDSLAAYSSGRS